ncbi:MAG TPA: nucleotide exchange factor GrpE [Anaerolineae bacterium]|nr:nucleotide exchange factor GrpE [Anaerolineae bacterium]
MDSIQQAEIQAKAEQLAALEAKVIDLETQIAALSSQAQEAETERGQLKAQVAENLDGWQRARAEFTNYKRRVEAERTELAASAGAEALKRVLPAVDDFERAMQTLPDDLKDNPWVNGVLMVQRKLDAALEQSGITPIVITPGDTFDPNIHEAVTHEDSEQFASEQIIGEVQRGYKLGERVLRPAMVRVAR